MVPTYESGQFVLCWRLRYVFREPRLGDVVMVRLAGPKVMYLKRIVALAGDTVAFRAGRLVRNGDPVSEPYVQGPCDWELAERTVEPGHVYVVGDNRSMPMDGHKFGQVSVKRLEGGPLW
jgi:signal peptidase I